MRDHIWSVALRLERVWVSVPLRGKEGAGPGTPISQPLPRFSVSVPLRGKEGAGLKEQRRESAKAQVFPSPCGVRRVRDLVDGPRVVG